jgi:probable HAF family extracellular repeat protein
VTGENTVTGRQHLYEFLIAGLACWVATPSDAQQYNLRALGVGPPTQVYYGYTTPKINNSGQVVGNRSTGGYLFSGSTLTPLALNALDINNNGAIAMFSGGDSFLSFPPYTAWSDMGILQSCLLGDTIATSLNDGAVAVGIADAPTTCPLPFRSANGQMTAIGPSQPKARWMAINNASQIVGFVQSSAAIRAVELINGVLTDLDPNNATAYDSEAIAINDSGQFVVNSNEAYCTRRLGPPSYKLVTYACRGSYWSPLLYSNGTPTNLGSLGSYGGTAAGMNSWGDVVGTSQTSTGAQHAFLYSAGSLSDINSHTILVYPSWTILQAYDINDSGQIVALAADYFGNQDVVVLTPVASSQTITSLTLNPTTVLGGIAGHNTSTGTVLLSSAAPAGGVVVSLASSNPVAQVPASIRVSAGATTATFTVTTSTLAGSVNVTVTASANASSKTATLTVTDVGS